MSQKVTILEGKYELTEGFTQKSVLNVYNQEFNFEHLTEAQAEFLISKKFYGIKKVVEKSTTK